MNLHKLYIPALVIVAALGVYAIVNLVLERESRIRAEEQDKASKQVIAEKNQAMADRDKQFNTLKADLENQITNIKTAKQAVTVLQPIIQPGGQGPAPAEVKKSDLPAEVQHTLPGASDAKFTLLTDDQLVALGKREKSCELSETGLVKCQADAADWKAKFDASQKDVETWKTAAKGGTWIKRTLRVAVPVGCAAGGAWLANKAAGNNNKAVVTGALVAGGGCALSFHF